MTLFPLISGESELDLVVSYLLGAGLLVISACVLAGIVYLHNGRGDSNLLQGKSGFIHLQSFPRLLNAILHGRSTQRGALFFVALAVIGAALVLLFVALAFSCVCFARMEKIEYVLVMLLAIVLLTTSFIQR